MISWLRIVLNDNLTCKMLRWLYLLCKLILSYEMLLTFVIE